MCVRILWACLPEHNEGLFQPHAVQQRHNSSSSGTTATLTYIGTPFATFDTTAVSGLQANHMPNGNPEPFTL